MTQLFMDIECYRNYFLVMFMAASGHSKSFELHEGHPLDVAGVRRFLDDKAVEIITFNGNGYDMPMLSLALRGVDNSTLKDASDDIIVNGLKPWEFEKKYAALPIETNHIDLIEIAPGMVSLKIYGGRLHCDKLQDLPIEPGALIEPGDRLPLRTYCRNDLQTTHALYRALVKQIDLRRSVSKEIGIDVRSKSDAQIAEAVLKQAIQKATGHTPRKQPITYTRFNYVAPAYVQFSTQQLHDVLVVMRNAKFQIKDTGHVEMPPEIDELDIRIGGTKYKIGIGGLHSQESEVSHYATEDTILRDIDVVSYYPNLMLNMGMFPDALGREFLVAYRKILVERVEAKRAGNMVLSDMFKIVLNGTFGKTSSKYSILYNPSMMIHTTLTGQLSILMLIEALEKRGIPVVSANTDGIVVKCPVGLESLQRRIVYAWQEITKLETEETNYSSIHSRDVNSYVAIKTDSSIKTKGMFAKGGLSKSPQNEICVDAVLNYLTNKTPVEDTIRSSQDITKFITLRTVKGGAVKEGHVLGKAIRWYYAAGETGTINYRSNGNLVPRSEGAMPIMDLPDEFPVDVNHDWYIREANDLLMDIGVIPRPPVVKLPRKNSKAWKLLVEEGLIVT